MPFYKKDLIWNKKVKIKLQSAPIDPNERNAWIWFSKYIRLRDCIRTTGRKDIGRCISCNCLINFKGNDAGHWITIGIKATKFDEKNCHLQCASCNRFKEGMKPQMYEAMLKIYGQAEIEALLARSRGIVRYVDYEKLADHYRNEYNTLKKTPLGK